MATLQNIRSKGPLLVIFIGLALFAFIAGDAWRVLQPHQTSDVGEVNGKSLSAQEYQALVEEYTEVIKFTNNLNSLTEEQNNQVKDEVWRSFVNNTLIQTEAEKIGLKVSKEEVEAIVQAGVHPMLQNTPFRNQQTGAFDNDMLKKFLVEYSKIKGQGTASEYYQYYTALYNYWTFIEKNLMMSRLVEKYQALINNAVSSNPVEAKLAFDARANEYDLLLAAVPYSSVPDSTVNVSGSDIKALYDKRKEQFKQLVETRDIKYIDVQVVASDEDKAALNDELIGYFDQLKNADAAEYTSLVRGSKSLVPYVDVYYRKDAYPADVIARLDSVATGEVYGPYFNSSDNTLNVFKKVARSQAADSVQFRQIQVYKEDAAQTKVLADSIYNAIKGGAKFEDIAQLYGQTGDANWLSSAQYEGAQLSGDDLKYISAVTSLGTNELANLQLTMGNMIVQVVNKKNTVDKYKIALVKRTVDFSNETYNKAYNKFSQFVAANTTLDQLTENAEDAGYRLLERSDLPSSSNNVAGITGSKDALRWIYAAKPGEVSGLFEVGNNDRMLVVGLNKVNKEGYRPVEDVQLQLRAELVKEKKAEKIMANMASAGSFAQYTSLDAAVSDTIKHVTFSAPAFVSVLRSSEPVVGAVASITSLNSVSAPFKGNAGVMVVQPINKEVLDEEFTADAEMETLAANYERMLTRFLNDLYLKANVKDQRYLFF